MEESEGFVMLGKDESLLHDDEFSFFYLRYFYLISKQSFYKLGFEISLNVEFIVSYISYPLRSPSF